MTTETTDGVESDGEGGTRRVREARARVESLRAEDGRFCVACRRTGVRPEPVTGACFGSYEDAAAACEAASRYRAAMRTVDPDLPEYDLDACEVGDRSVQFASVREVVDHDRRGGLPRATTSVTLAGDGYEEWFRVENAPVVHLAGRDSPLDDELVSRQLDSKL